VLCCVLSYHPPLLLCCWWNWDFCNEGFLQPWLKTNIPSHRYTGIFATAKMHARDFCNGPKMNKKVHKKYTKKSWDFCNACEIRTSRKSKNRLGFLRRKSKWRKGTSGCPRERKWGGKRLPACEGGEEQAAAREFCWGGLKIDE